MTDPQIAPTDRRQFLGASDIGKAWTGVYGGRYGVVAAKLTGDTDIDPADAARGWRWEHPIADAVKDLTGYYCFGEQLQVVHPDNERWRATVDGFLDMRPEGVTLDTAEALLEVKTSRQSVPPKWNYYSAQTQWQMFVCGKTSALIAVAIIGVDKRTGDEMVVDLKLRWEERDDYTIERMVAMAGELWSYVEAGELPDPDEHTDIDDVRRMNAEADPNATADIDDLAELIARREELTATAKQAYAEAKQIEATLRARMGEATEATTSDGRWRLRVGNPVYRFTDRSADAALLEFPHLAKTVLDKYKFKELHPGKYDDYKEPSADRRLTVKDFNP